MYLDDGIHTSQDAHITKLEKIYGKEKLLSIKNATYNDKLEEFVVNSFSGNRIAQENGRLVPTIKQIYFDGSKEYFIRAHFFAPRKNVFGTYYSTYWINVSIIWFMSVVLLAMLYYDVLRKILDWFSTIQLGFKKIRA